MRLPCWHAPSGRPGRAPFAEPSPGVPGSQRLAPIYASAILSVLTPVAGQFHALPRKRGTADAPSADHPVGVPILPARAAADAARPNAGQRYAEGPRSFGAPDPSQTRSPRALAGRAHGQRVPRVERADRDRTQTFSVLSIGVWADHMPHQPLFARLIAWPQRSPTEGKRVFFAPSYAAIVGICRSGFRPSPRRGTERAMSQDPPRPRRTLTTCCPS